MEAFDGRVKFNMLPRSLDTQMKARTLNKQLDEAVKSEDDEIKNHVSNLAWLIGHTDSIEFNFKGGEKSALMAFRKWWEGKDKLKPAELFAGRRKLADAIISAWVEAFEDEQDLFEVPVEQKSITALPDELRTEALKDGSPLTSPVESSPVR